MCPKIQIEENPDFQKNAPRSYQPSWGHAGLVPVVPTTTPSTEAPTIITTIVIEGTDYNTVASNDELAAGLKVTSVIMEA